MGDYEVPQQEFGFTCYNCGRIIPPGEKMITMSASLETPNEDGSVQVIESTAISIVCYSCSLILSKSLDVIVNELNDGDVRAELDVHCSERGFQFELHCSDGIGWALSPIFNWEQIFQMLIAADPDMFGILTEPLHQVFPKSLRLLGYCVPNWRENYRETQNAN